MFKKVHPLWVAGVAAMFLLAMVSFFSFDQPQVRVVEVVPSEAPDMQPTELPSQVAILPAGEWWPVLTAVDTTDRGDTITFVLYNDELNTFETVVISDLLGEFVHVALYRSQTLVTYRVRQGVEPNTGEEGYIYHISHFDFAVEFPVCSCGRVAGHEFVPSYGWFLNGIPIIALEAYQPRPFRELVSELGHDGVTIVTVAQNAENFVATFTLGDTVVHQQPLPISIDLVKGNVGGDILVLNQ